MSPVQVKRVGGQIAVVDDDGTPVGDAGRFLEWSAVRGFSPRTIEAYAYDLALILRWLRAQGRDLAKLDSGDLLRFIASERERNCQAKSINRRLATLRLFYRFVRGAELPGSTEPGVGSRWRKRDWELGLQAIPSRALRKVRVREPRRLVTPLTPAQVQAFLATLHRFRDLAIVYLMLLCGLRSAEALQLRCDSVDLVDRRVRVMGKGSKERVVPLPRLAATVIERYLAVERPRSACDRLFVLVRGSRRGQPMTRASLRRVFRDSRAALPTLSNANPHRFRHTFGADMAREGVRLPVLQRMMGHAHPETTLQYVNLSATDIAAEFEKAITAIEARYRQEGEGT